MALAQLASYDCRNHTIAAAVTAAATVCGPQALAPTAQPVLEPARSGNCSSVQTNLELFFTAGAEICCKAQVLVHKQHKLARTGADLPLERERMP